jgi:hypothetical protein
VAFEIELKKAKLSLPLQMGPEGKDEASLRVESGVIKAANGLISLEALGVPGKDSSSSLRLSRDASIEKSITGADAAAADLAAVLPVFENCSRCSLGLFSKFVSFRSINSSESSVKCIALLSNDFDTGSEVDDADDGKVCPPNIIIILKNCGKE